MLCESCVFFYAKEKDIVDILPVIRPPNNKLWSVYIDSDNKNQNAVPFEKFPSDNSWAPLNGFSSKEIKALNFAKILPLDSKFMVIIGGTSSTEFPFHVSNSIKTNLFLIDLLNNEVYMKK